LAAVIHKSIRNAASNCKTVVQPWFTISLWDIAENLPSWDDSAVQLVF